MRYGWGASVRGLEIQTKLAYSVDRNLNFMSKRTYQPSKQKRATTHGFLVRSGTKTGSNVLQARRRKGRAQLTVRKSK